MCWFRKKKNYTIGEKNETLVIYKELPKRELKLNYNLIVPENFVCFVFTKEKLTDSFQTGEAKLYALTLPETSEIHHLDKPTKDGYKKSVKADLLFVNLKEFALKNTFKIKKEKEKINLSYSLNYKIKDAKKFLAFLLNERAFFKNDYAEKQLNYYVSYLLYYYFFDNEYDEEKFKKYVENKLLKIGVEILNFELEREFVSNVKHEIFNDFRKDDRSVLKNVQKNKLDEENSFENGQKDYNLGTKKENSFENIRKNIEPRTWNGENVEDGQRKNALQKEEFRKSVVLTDDFENGEETIRQTIEYFTCECGAILPRSAKVCFRCKRSFEDEDKILCENCGREIGENVHVCPHCHSVLF